MAIATDRDTWLAERLSGIGGSDSAAILGASKWYSPFRLWSEKVGLVEPEDLSDSEPVEWGNRLEPVIAEAYQERTGRMVELNPPFLITKHPQYDWMRATLDARQFDTERGPGILQIKTTNEYKGKDWDDEPPLQYQIQLQHEIAVAGEGWGTLCVLIGGQRLRWFDMDRNDKFIAALIEKLKAFWQLVLTKTPPEPDASRATTEALAKLYPSDNGETVLLPAEADDWDAVLQECKAERTKLDAREREAKNKLTAAIGAATFGMLGDGSRYSLKTVERDGYEVKPSTYRTLRRLVK